jgi:hypothetical protein
MLIAALDEAHWPKRLAGHAKPIRHASVWAQLENRCSGNLATGPVSALERNCFGAPKPVGWNERS